MGILTKEVEVIPSGRSIKHYKDLGYDVKCRKPLTVKVADLQNGSNVKIQYLCDYCENEIITIVYADYIRRTKEVNKMACRHCFTKKMEDTVSLRYGVSSYAKTEDCQEKTKNIIESKYGVKHYSQTQEYKNKWHNTCVERYGESYRKKFAKKAFETFRDKTGYNYPSQSPDVREKMVQSCIDHYGVNNPQLSEELRKKTENTCVERYGCTAPTLSPEIREKMVQSLYKNGTVATSKQQFYLYNLYKEIDGAIELNYPISYFNGDICFLNKKIVVEYDGGGHNLQVKFHGISEEEFRQKEIIRNNVFKNEGYKMIRIISSKDLLPLDTVLIQMLESAFNYFSECPNHSWIEFDIDASFVRNAKNKDGISYNYGELRRIKE